jgi:hypothetical protein
MNRRTFALTALALAALPAAAHHGWSSFEQDKPVYLAGEVKSVRWQNPHAEAVVEVAAGQKLPADWASRALPAQSQSVDAAAIRAKAQPAAAAGSYELEFAPLTRMQAWGLAEPLKPGDRIEAVGYIAPNLKGGKLMRVEYLFVNGKAYGLRSMPAAS